MAKGIYCRACLFLAILCGASPGFATIFGTVRGVVFDPQHLPIKGAPVTIRARASEWSRTAQTDAEGRFEFRAVPVGEYVVGVNLSGFTRLEQPVAVTSGAAPILQIQLKLAAVEENVVVSSAAEPLDPASSTTQSIVSREEIARTPGADRSNSLAMITNYVPGAYMVHDQLHIRGGHQVTWFPTRTSRATSGRSSIRRTSTISRCSAAATRQNMATAFTGSSMSCLAQVSRGIMRDSSSQASAASIRQTTRSALAATPNDSRITPV